jgi:hypothetical protein
MIEIELLLPIGESPPDHAGKLAPRLSHLNGKTIGIISNSWQCMTTLSDQFAIDITERYGAEAIRITSPTLSAMPTEMLEHIKNHCDGVIVGMGT